MKNSGMMLSGPDCLPFLGRDIAMLTSSLLISKLEKCSSISKSMSVNCSVIFNG